MTSTVTRPLHDFEGKQVDRATVKIVKCGDGLSDALSIEPEEIELSEVRYFVIKTTCSRVSVETDAKKITSRVHTMSTLGITKIDDGIAEKMLQTAAAELKRKQNEVKGQLTLDAESAASEREKADQTDTPAEVAGKAKDRALNSVADPFQKPATD